MFESDVSLPQGQLDTPTEVSSITMTPEEKVRIRQLPTLIARRQSGANENLGCRVGAVAQR